MSLFDLSPLSWVAVAVMAVATAAAFSKRFLAWGALMLANIAVFLIVLFSPAAGRLLGTDRLAPEGFTVLQSDLSLYPPHLFAFDPLGFLQVFTSMFVHGNLMHLFGNMLFLYVFGAPFEDRIGGRRFMVIYLVSGVFGDLCQIAAYAFADDWAVSLGASGAIFGIMCAFAAKYPNQIVGVPIPALFIFFRIPMRVVYGALMWVGYNILLAYVDINQVGGVGYFAHLGGGLAGALLAVVIVRGSVGVPGRGGPIAIDLGALGDFARDGPTKEVLNHMRANHDEPEVFQAWLDRFFRTATCPTCSHRVMPKHRGEVVCTQGHRFDVRRDRRTELPAA
jgi:membrane associated rhomboid family serine protease/DNA-directed RNA polymerase subunit RPC12/RpoP